MTAVKVKGMHQKTYNKMLILLSHIQSLEGRAINTKLLAERCDIKLPVARRALNQLKKQGTIGRERSGRIIYWGLSAKQTGATDEFETKLQ